MIKFLILSTTLSAVLGSQYPPQHPPSYEKPSYGHQSYSEPHYQPSPYAFGYKVDDGYGNNNYRKEEGDSYGNKKGAYGYTDAYGVYRYVEYVADEHGFRVNIKTNEPGTKNEDPADVYITALEPPAVTNPGSPQKYEHASYKPAAYPAPAPSHYDEPPPKYPAPTYPKPATKSYPAPPAHKSYPAPPAYPQPSHMSYPAPSTYHRPASVESYSHRQQSYKPAYPQHPQPDYKPQTYEQPAYKPQTYERPAYKPQTYEQPEQKPASYEEYQPMYTPSYPKPTPQPYPAPKTYPNQPRSYQPQVYQPVQQQYEEPEYASAAADPQPALKYVRAAVHAVRSNPTYAKRQATSPEYYGDIESSNSAPVAVKLTPSVQYV